MRVATRMGSTACRPSQLRCTARTILFRSTGSWPPLRLVTLIAVAVGGGVSENASFWDGAVPASATALSIWVTRILQA